MNFIGIDLEGVLIPEIWVSLAEKTGINELKLTTKDISDYKELMKIRIDILKKKQLKSNRKKMSKTRPKLLAFLIVATGDMSSVATGDVF